MMTARDMIAKAFRRVLDEPGQIDSFDHHGADKILSALLSAPEPVRLELAALLNPWRPIETAPIHKTVFVGRRGDERRVTAYKASPGSWWCHVHTGEKICFEPTKWQPLPAPPSEDKA